MLFDVLGKQNKVVRSVCFLFLCVEFWEVNTIVSTTYCWILILEMLDMIEGVVQCLCNIRNDQKSILSAQQNTEGMATRCH